MNFDKLSGLSKRYISTHGKNRCANKNMCKQEFFIK